MFHEGWAFRALHFLGSPHFEKMSGDFLRRVETALLCRCSCASLNHRYVQNRLQSIYVYHPLLIFRVYSLIHQHKTQYDPI